MFLPFILTQSMCVYMHLCLCMCTYVIVSREIETSLGCLVWVTSSFYLRLLVLAVSMCFESIDLACCMMTRQYTCTHACMYNTHAYWLCTPWYCIVSMIWHCQLRNTIIMVFIDPMILMRVLSSNIICTYNREVPLYTYMYIRYAGIAVGLFGWVARPPPHRVFL